MVHLASKKKAYSSYLCACIRWAQSIWKHTSNVLSSLPEDARDGFKSRRRESCALLCWMGWMGCCRCLSAPFALYVRPSLVSMQTGSLCRIPEEKPPPLNEWIRARAASQKLGSCLPRHLDCLKCRSSRVGRRLSSAACSPAETIQRYKSIQTDYICKKKSYDSIWTEFWCDSSDNPVSHPLLSA